MHVHSGEFWDFPMHTADTRSLLSALVVAVGRRGIGCADNIFPSCESGAGATAGVVMVEQLYPSREEVMDFNAVVYLLDAASDLVWNVVSFVTTVANVVARFF